VEAAITVDTYEVSLIPSYHWSEDGRSMAQDTASAGSSTHPESATNPPTRSHFNSTTTPILQNQ
jgi:hypothetical protein